LLFGSDLFHCSQHLTALPLRKTVTATIFDLSCWATPQYHTARNIAATKLYGERVLGRCDGLIAKSEHAARDGVEVRSLTPARMRVIYPGVTDAFFAVTPPETMEVRTRYSLTQPYILFVGCIEPRKNVPAIIRAYRHLPDALRREAQLVLAGPIGWAAEQFWTIMAEHNDNIRYLGYVPECDLPGIYAGASVFVFPS